LKFKSKKIENAATENKPVLRITNLSSPITCHELVTSH